MSDWWQPPAVARRTRMPRLYRRHAPQALRVARQVTGNDEDASDAVAEAFTKVLQVLRSSPSGSGINFRPYLLVATRHAAIDIGRRKARVSPSTEVGALESTTGFDHPGALVAAEADARLLTDALRLLSGRERRLLWLVEVEDMALRDAAAVLGVKPNHAAQLAVRARRRLRRGYMRALLGDHVAAGCRSAVGSLPAYVDGGLTQRSLDEVDGHIHACQDCQYRLEELRDLPPRLRRARSCCPPYFGHPSGDGPGEVGGLRVTAYDPALRCTRR